MPHQPWLLRACRACRMVKLTRETHCRHCKRRLRTFKAEWTTHALVSNAAIAKFRPVFWEERPPELFKSPDQ